jgi:para-nitrobenzyl esterase
MKRFLAIFVVLLSLLSLVIFTGTPVAAAASNSSIVRTVNGAVKGIVNSSNRQFLGIPYAAPPVGNLRWKAPQPAASWSGVRDATQFGSICTQVGSPLTGVPQPGVDGSENCLFLNVYTPNPVQANRPVMVWIHGGGFTGGAGSLYDPSIIAKNGNAIVVTINYRLGPLGYLALPGLSAENARGTSGNYGLEDQQAALRWVRANIANFGGNPFNVTIFGESAGGASVCDQIASPFATGLFQKAITESGPCANPSQTLATSQKNGTTFANNLGCSSATVACLRSLSAGALVTAAAQDPAISFSPNVDGVILPQQVKTAISSGKYNHVPVLEGTNRNEDTIFVLAQISATGVAIPLTASQYTAEVELMFGSEASQVLAQYPLSSAISPDAQLANLVTDARFSCPANTADNLFSKGTLTYAYEFSDPNPFQLLAGSLTPPDFSLGDAHADELPSVFQGQFVTSVVPLTPAQLGLSNQVIQYWTRFAATGNPNSFATPFWPLNRTNSDLFQSLTSAGNGPHAISNFSAEHQCAFWATLGI